MSASSFADEPRRPFLIILHPRHPHRTRARCSRYFFFFFLSFFLFIARERWFGASEGQSGDPEKARRKERSERGREKERGEKSGMTGGVAREEEYF